MKVHELKTDADVFQATVEKKKNFEIRKNDRDFQVSDILHLRETLYTGAEMAQGKPLNPAEARANIQLDSTTEGGLI